MIRNPVDYDDIDALMAEDLDAKGDELWEQGAREILGDAEFEQLYPELKKEHHTND